MQRCIAFRVLAPSAPGGPPEKNTIFVVETHYLFLRSTIFVSGLSGRKINSGSENKNSRSEQNSYFTLCYSVALFLSDPLFCVQTSRATERTIVYLKKYSAIEKQIVSWAVHDFASD